MQYKEFLGQVQNRAQLSGLDEAEHVTRVVLQTLAERLAGGEPFDLASQLPPEIGRYLEHVMAGAGEPLSLDDFILIISSRLVVDTPTAVQLTRAVLSVVRDAVSPGEMRDVRAQLPQEFDLLLSWGNEGPRPEAQL